MYYSITIQWLSKIKVIDLPSLFQVQGLQNLLNRLFRIDENKQITGVTDSQGKFYDFQIFAFNLKIFKNKKVKLITQKRMNNENKQDEFDPFFNQNQNGKFLNKIHPISFGKRQFIHLATNNPHELEIQDFPFNFPGEIDLQDMDLPIENEDEMIAEIYNIGLFQRYFLPQKLTIVLEAKNKLTAVNFRYYYLKGNNEKISVYKQKFKLCEIFLSGLRKEEIHQVIRKLIKKSMKQTNNKKAQDFDQKNSQNSIKVDKNQHFEKNERAQCKYFNKDQNFEYKHFAYSPIENESFFKDEHPKFRVKQHFVTENTVNANKKYDIPIIIRKNNNKIQMITASCPLSQDQTQAINSLSELQIQGLLSDKEINEIRMMVLGSNIHILTLFEFFTERKINVRELCRKLTALLTKNYGKR